MKNFFEECDARVLSAKNTAKKFRALEIAVMFRLLYSTGMRTTEARLLRVIDVDLPHAVINIRKSKNSIEHYVALHPSMAALLKRYGDTAEKSVPGRELYFPYKDEATPFTPDMLTWEFHKVWDSVNTGNAVPYDFRHNYAIQNINSWLSGGFSFNDKFLYLSKSMGHEIGRSTVPLEWGADEWYLSTRPSYDMILRRLMLAGDFLDFIFDSPETLHELVTDMDLSEILQD